MTPDDRLSNNHSGRCAKPTCGSIAQLASNVCSAHDAPESSSGRLINQLPRVTHFTESHVTARRGHYRLRLHSLRRSSAKSQASSDSNKLPGRTDGLKSQGETKDCSPHDPDKFGELEDHAESDSAIDLVSLEKITSPPRHLLYINEIQKPKLSDPVHRSKFGSEYEGTGEVFSSIIPHPKTNGCSKVLDQTDLSRNHNGKTRSLSSSPGNAELTASNLALSRNHMIQSPEASDCIYGRMPSSTQPSVNDEVASKPVSAKSPPLVNSSKHIAFAHIKNSEIDKACTPLSRFCESRFGVVEDNGIRPAPEALMELESCHSHSPQILAEESDCESQYMDLDSSPMSERHIDSDDDQKADTHDSPNDEQQPAVNLIISPAEASRAKKLARFDPAAFDARIYRQSGLLPQTGVPTPGCSPRMPMASSNDNRLALHANPVIHRMHNRSEEWYKRKSKEIEERGGRKSWFGKVNQRQRYLRSREAATEKERERARRAGLIPHRRDPQPRGYKGIKDFGKIPESELPEYVRKDPAWLKACAWFRETRNLPN